MCIIRACFMSPNAHFCGCVVVEGGENVDAYILYGLSTKRYAQLAAEASDLSVLYMRLKGSAGGTGVGESAFQMRPAQPPTQEHRSGQGNTEHEVNF